MSSRGAPLGIACTLLIFAVAFRILPHPANFAPVAAIALFGGAVLPRKLALWVPLIAIVVSDLIIGFYDIMPIIWGCYVLTALAGSLWLRKPSIARGVALTTGASISFFIITNFAVWAFTGMYVHSWSGLMDCYAMAIPFFRNTLLSDLFFTAALFGLHAALRRIVLKLLVVQDAVPGRL